MAIGVIYQVNGARDFDRDLTQVSAEIRQKADAACRDTALNIRRRAKAGAPRDRGDLIANIAADGKNLNYRVGILDVSLPSRGGTNPAHLNPWVYGVWYEYGFVMRQIPTTPYMRPAADAEDGPHVARMTAAINSGVAKAAA